MIANLTKSMLLLAGCAALLAGCPNNPDGTETEAERNAEAAMERAGENTRKALDNAKETAGEAGAEIKETTEQAGEAIKEGYANFTEEARQKYPDVVASMQRNMDAMNDWTVDSYNSVFAPDAPRRDELVAAYRAEAPNKPSYNLRHFAVDSATETEAVATVEMVKKGTDASTPLAERTVKYKYTFRKAADTGEWQIYDVEELPDAPAPADAASAG